MTAALNVERIGPGATLQDRGRPGHMHDGVPPGGALDPALYRRTLRALGHDDTVAAVEIPWHGARFRAVGDVTVSVDGHVTPLADGQSLDVPAAPYAVRYLALRHGIGVPTVLGSRGTLLVASLGGLDGRMLHRGDVLPVGDALVGDVTDTPWSPALGMIPVWRGPDDFSDAAWSALCAHTFTVTSQVDRTGMRLRGDGVRYDGAAVERSRPMVRGALEVTPDGTLIALGPDHPTTGGYPVIGVVDSRFVGALAQHRPDVTVRFVDARHL